MCKLKLKRSNAYSVAGNQRFIRTGNGLLPYGEDFRIFIVTKTKNTHYLREIIARTTVVDFAVQREGLEKLLLKTLIDLENPGLEELKEKTELDIEKDERCIVELQDELLKLLNESKCSLLENEQLVQTLKSSKSKFSVIKEQLQSSLASRAEIYIAREVYGFIN